jgi:hypothetical protein
MRESDVDAKYELLSEWKLKFAEPEQEQAYVDDIMYSNYKNIKLAFLYAGVLGHSVTLLIFVFLIFPSPALWSWETVGQNLARFTFSFSSIAILRLMPPKYLEYALCFIISVLTILFFGSNQFRLKRFNIAELPQTRQFLVWEHCDEDLAIHNRDVMHACIVFVCKMATSAFCNIRTKTSLLPDLFVWISVVTYAALPSQRLADGGGTVVLAVTFTFGMFCSWFGALRHERDHRHLWALRRLGVMSSRYSSESSWGLCFRLW